MNILLDTHVLLWYLGRDPRFPQAWWPLLVSENRLLLSDVSVWEISIKYGLGKLKLPDHPRIWIPDISAQFGLLPHPIERRHVLGTADLPRHHGDPFDRLLVVQALEDDLFLMTRDEAILRYGIKGV